MFGTYRKTDFGMMQGDAAWSSQRGSNHGCRLVPYKQYFVDGSVCI